MTSEHGVELQYFVFVVVAVVVVDVVVGVVVIVFVADSMKKEVILSNYSIT